MNKTEFSGLNDNEVKVLIAIRAAIEECTGNQFCYFQEITVEGLSVNQVKGYLSSLQGKDRIYCDDEAEQISMVNRDGYVICDITDETDWVY